jgi:hypothetical protein
MRLKPSLYLPAFLLCYSACMQLAGAEQQSVPELAAATPGEASESPANGKSREEGEGFPRHNLNLLVRYTFDDSEKGLTTGLEYEYRFHRRFGIGGMLEYIAGDINVSLAGVMVNVHPWRELVLVIGPGIEFDSAEHDTFLRVGALYEFKAGPVFIGPAVIVDTFRDEGHALIVGGQVGVKF